MTNQETDSLLKRTGCGDDEALRTLYIEFKATVFHFALSITGDYYYSQDILQDTFVRLKNGSYKSGNAKAYIFTITRNLAVNYLHQRSKNCGEEAISSLEPSNEIFRQNTELVEALSSLMPVERQIVLLHVLGGLKHREIAASLQIPIGTTLWKYHKAIAKLRNLIEERGHFDEGQETFQFH